MTEDSHPARADQASDTPQVIAANIPGKGVKFILRQFGPTTLVAIHPGTKRIEACWLDDDILVHVAEWAERMSAAGYNLYFAVNQPSHGVGRKPAKTDIAVIRAAAHADVDAKNGRTLSQALEAIAALPAPTSIIIASGGGFQPIWLLSQAVPATDESVWQAEANGQQIAALIGGDAVHNIDRIMRMPFTMNFPDERKRAAGRVPCPAGVVFAGCAE